MPSYLKDYVTEYNFLFHEIYNMAKVTTKGDKVKMIENQYTHFTIYPIICESFWNAIYIIDILILITLWLIWINYLIITFLV